MKLSELFEAVVKHGMTVDPRGESAVLKELEKTRKSYEELKDDEKARFDEARLSNPYSDSRMLYGAGDIEVKDVLVGIDTEVGEVVLADRLREKGTNIDLLWGHHPEGHALANLDGVMAMQADILHSFGVPVNVADGILAPRIKEVGRNLMPTNHMRAVDAAKLLDVPMICTHTPADNSVVHYLQLLFDEHNPETVGDVIDLLREIPEYQQAEAIGAALKVFVGDTNRRTGRILVDMTGGTGGSEHAFEKLANTTDVGTVVGMHISEKNRKQAEKHHISVVIAGHMASDTLGMNLLLDGVEALTRSKLNVIECSGFRRVRRGH